MDWVIQRDHRTYGGAMPIIKYLIRIVNDDSEGVPGKEVSVYYDLTQDSDFTDEEGWVKFKKDNLLEPMVRATIYVDGEQIKDISAHDGDTFSLSI